MEIVNVIAMYVGYIMFILGSATLVIGATVLFINYIFKKYIDIKIFLDVIQESKRQGKSVFKEKPLS